MKKQRGRARSFGRLGAALVACLVFPACGPGAPPPPDVLLVTIDTLRADWVHAYGFARETTPRIDGLAARGVLFENAIAAATLTAPAHASIMTSRYARQHSVGTLNGETRLDGIETLAERFRAAGYETAAFVGNVVLRRRSGLDRGFDVYDDELVEGEKNRRAYFERTAAETAARALDWLAGRGGKPVFVWLHLQDPHGPYTPPDGYRGVLGEIPLRMTRSLDVLDDNTGRAGIPAYQVLGEERSPSFYAARYGEELLYADHSVGEVADAVERHAGARGSIILVTADHGESMGEQGWFFQHGHATTPDLARVPLVIVAPGAVPRRVSSLVSHVDVAPTLLELAGLAPIEGASGRSLADVVRGAAEPGARAVFSDTDGEAAIYFPDRMTRIGGALASDRNAPAPRPTQIQSIEWDDEGIWRTIETDQNDVQQLLQYLETPAPLVAAEAMSPEHIEQLRALGYLPPLPDEEASPSGADETD